MCVCVISNQSSSKKHYASDGSKLDALLHKTHIKVLLVQRLGMCRSILSLSKIAHQMWSDHPFSQRNVTTERTVEVGLRGNWEVEEGGGGGWTKFEKWEICNIRI